MRIPSNHCPRTLGRYKGGAYLPGEEAGIRYWPNPVKGETRHYDQQSAHTTALQQYGEKPSIYRYGSHEYILRNFPQERARGTSVTPDIDGSICWRLTIPQHDCHSVLQRLDRMNINPYTLFRTEDALVTVPHPVSWTHVCATRHGVARIARALRLACDTPAFRGASTGCSVRRTQQRPRAHRRGFERPGRRRLAP